MVVRILLLCTAVVVASSYPAVSHQSIVHHIQRGVSSSRSHRNEFKSFPENAHPKYEFSYAVADPHTGDDKQQQEVRDGDVVKGSYSFHEADGSIRTVEYSADDHNGFNAVVHNTAPTTAPTVLKASVYATAPVDQYHHTFIK